MPLSTLDASAPTRIDLAGGTLDIWPLYLFHDGAQTLNLAISIRAHVSLRPRDDRRIVVRSLDTGQHLEGDSGGGLVARSPASLLARLVHFFDVRGLTMTTRGESPAGAGLAGSSALNIAACGALARWTGREYSDEQLLTVAKDVEAQAIGVPTGWQDFPPALFGGIAALELGPGSIRRIPLDVPPADLEARLVLAYSGEPRASGTNNWDILKRHVDGDLTVRECFDRIRDIAGAMRHALAERRWDEVARQIALEWDNRKRLAPGVSTPVIEDLIDRAQKAGSLAAKVCGAGGGGCVMFFAEPDRVPDVRRAVAQGGARLLDYRIEHEGLRITSPAGT